MNKPKDLSWKVLDSEIAFKDRWITLRADTCQMPNGQIIAPYYVVDYPDWVTVLALTQKGEVILSRQYRHGRQVTVEELPSGTVEPNDENPERTVRRELKEETGYTFGAVYEIGRISPNPSNHSNVCYCFLALDGVKTSAQDLDPAEEIEVVILPWKKFLERLRQNQLLQAMHVACAYYAIQKLQELEYPLPL